MPLAVDAVTIGDIVIGKSGDDAYLGAGLAGLGIAPITTPSTQRADGGVAGGRQVEGAQTLTIEAPWTDDPEALMALRNLMHARPDPDDLIEVAWAGFGWPDEHVVFARPNGMEPIVTEDTVNGVYGFDLRFLLEDPTVYSYTPTVVTRSTPATSHTFTVENEGLHETRAGRAWTLSATTSGGSVFEPFVEINGVRVFVEGRTMAAGTSWTIDEHRIWRRGSLSLDGYAKTPGQVAPNYPTLAPGENTVVLGASSGSFTAVFTHRSTW